MHSRVSINFALQITRTTSNVPNKIFMIENRTNITQRNIRNGITDAGDSEVVHMGSAQYFFC